MTYTHAAPPVDGLLGTPEPFELTVAELENACDTPLSPSVRLRPRPEGNAYGLAAHRSMRGDHRPMIAVINRMIRDALRG